MITIVDIAKESGYSVSTVSRVLNNRQDVSETTKRKIMEIVEAHNFVPNNNAKHLKQGATKNIIMIVKGTSNMLFANIIEEIQTLLSETDYALRVYYLDEDRNEVAEAVRLCRERKPIGVLFLGGNPQNFKAEFEDVTVPSVLVTNRGDMLGFDNLSSIATDDEAAAEEAVNYLLSQGHRNIGIIGGDRHVSRTAKQRFMGCVRSFEKHGLEFDAESYFEKGRFSFESSYTAMKRLLEKNLPISAVFAMSDTMAVGAIRAICDAGKRVPEDISVMGFDGISLAEFYNPKIATIRQGYKELAARSTKVLLDMIDLGETASHEIIPFQLVEGESVKQI